MLSVNRESPQKILGLLKVVPDLIDEMEHVEILSRQKIQITPNRLNHLRDASTILALVMSFFILFTYKYEAFGIKQDLQISILLSHSIYI